MHPDLSRLRSFFVQATPKEPRYSPHVRVPAHQLVIEPLLSAAVQVRLTDDGLHADLHRLALSLGSLDQEGISLDLGREVLRGFEELWNAEGGRRGTLFFACDPSKLYLPAVFRWCDGPWVWASENQFLKGNTRTALRSCRKVARGGSLVFSFSSSNGIECMDVFGPEPQLTEAYVAALEHCRRFKRYVEHNPGATNEIITDRPPYSTSI